MELRYIDQLSHVAIPTIPENYAAFTGYSEQYGILKARYRISSSGFRLPCCSPWLRV